MRLRPAGLGAVLLLLLATACGSGDPGSRGDGTTATIRFASYDFPENQILAEVYAEAARRAGLPVSVQHGVGTREVVAPALQQGVVDVVVDYLGTALAFAGPDGVLPGPDAGGDARRAQPDALDERGVVRAGRRARPRTRTASPSPPRSGPRTASAGCRTSSTWRRSSSSAGRPSARTGRSACAGCEEVYGLEFGEVRSMPSRAATVEALISGQIDVGLLETTDARLAVAPIMLLIDDRALQPHENVVPLVRTEVARALGRPS